MNDWCILRTGGARTVPLARSLAAAGLEAWTPVQYLTRRLPRSKVTRAMEVAFTPTYVFARAEHLASLRHMERLPVHRHPTFSIFRYYGETVFVSDAAVAGLRQAEADSQHRADQRQACAAARGRKRKSHGDPFQIGAPIKPDAGLFAGMSGVVQQSNGRHTLVLFDMKLRVHIETSQLRRDAVASAVSAA